MLQLIWIATVLALVADSWAIARPPFFKIINSEYVIGNDIWNTTIGSVLARKLYYRGIELVGRGRGHFVSHSGGSALSFNQAPPSIHKQTDTHLDVVFHSKEGDLHWVLTPTLPGAYQYFVNRALPILGEFRTIWIFDNRTFTHGVTVERNERLPPLSDIKGKKKIGDETFQRSDGSSVTKYDFSAFLGNVEGDLSYWGVSGSNVASWYIHGGKDYLNGDHLKQELMVHRESTSGDTVQLNMIHGTHFQGYSHSDFPVGKTWGPWLWYLNNGSVTDVKARAREENAAWPYSWHDDTYGYQNRGSISGKLSLSDGRPASMAAVFLGDNRPGPDNTTLDQGARYYYRTYTDRMGAFIIPHVRSGTYNLQAWPNGGKIGDVTTVFSQNDVTIVPGSENNLNGLGWKTQDRKRIWQIGNMDRKATGFKYAGSPRNNDIHKKCPGSLVYNVGKSKPTDWCFAQWDVGQWSINFDITASSNVLPEAVLSVSLAAYTTGKGSNVFVNNVRIGSLFSASFLGDPAIARSATLAGEWRYIELRIPLGVLKNGPNLVEIRMAKINGLNGYIYDSVLLEWA